MALWKNDWTGFFLVYFEWCYYLCVSPFHFKWDQSQNKFRIARNRLQSVACILLYFLLGLWYLKDLRKIPVDHLYKNPVVYFSLAFNLNAIYYHIGVLAVSFWRRQDSFLAIVNFECEGYASSNVKTKLSACMLCFLFAILPLLYSLCGYSVISSSRIWDPSLMFRCLVVEGRFAFFVNGTATKLATDSCSKYQAPDLDEMNIMDTFLGALAFLMETARQIVGFYSDFFPLICCLSIWTCTGILREFLQTAPTCWTSTILANQHSYCRGAGLSISEVVPIKENNASKQSKETNNLPGNGNTVFPCIICKAGSISAPVGSSEKVGLQQKDGFLESGGNGELKASASCFGGIILGNVLLERYEVCKSFTRTVNKALGQLLFAYVLSSIMYLSTCMDAVLVLQDWFGKLRVAFFFFIFILMFFIGSETVNKVYWVRSWLSDPTNNAFLPEKNLLVLIHEVTCKSIGVTGNGMFTITYSTFMTVMTTTVTFFIIILQFQKPRADWDDLSSTVNALNTSLHGLNTLIAQLSFQMQNASSVIVVN